MVENWGEWEKGSKGQRVKKGPSEEAVRSTFSSWIFFAVKLLIPLEEMEKFWRMSIRFHAIHPTKQPLRDRIAQKMEMGACKALEWPSRDASFSGSFLIPEHFLHVHLDLDGWKKGGI